MEQLRLEANLIELVKDTPFLYDATSSQYDNKTLKTERFQEIGDLLGLSGDEAEKLWQNLRARYKAYLNDPGSCKSTPGSRKRIKFQHAKIFEFFRDTCDNLGRSESISSPKIKSETKPKISATDDANESSSENCHQLQLPIEPEPSCVFCCKSVGSGVPIEKFNCLLDKELKTMFIVQKLLGVPRSVSEDLLGKYGNPSNWIRICWTCEDLVNESKSLFRRIQHLARSFQKLKDAAEKKVEESDERQKRTIGGAAGKLRQAVLKGVGKPHVHGGSSEIRQDKCNPEPDVNVKLEFQSETEEFEEDSAFINEAMDEDDNAFHGDESFEDNIAYDEEATTGDVNDDEWIPESPPAKRRRTRTQTLHSKRNKTRTISATTTPKLKKGRKGKYIRAFDDEVCINQKCHLCKISYSRKKDLWRHFRIVHDHFTKDMLPKPEGYACDLCDVNAKNVAALNKHKLSEHSDQILKCPHCPKIFNRTEELKRQRHIGYFHDGDELRDPADVEGGGANANDEFNCDKIGDVFTCPWCGYQTSLRPSYIRHKREVHWNFCVFSMKSQKGLLQLCKVCNEEFNNVSSLRNHCLTDHKMIECKKCPALFLDVPMLRGHDSKIHRKDRTSDLVVVSSGDLKNPENYDVDDVDGNIDEDAIDLDGPYKCDQCDVVKRTKLLLDTHIRIKHWIVPHIPSNPTDASMNCKCTVCDENFGGGDALKQHCIEVHKMFLCELELCDRLFVTKLKLDVHKDVKHKIPCVTKPHKCNYCPNRYAKPHQLAEHLRRAHLTYAGSSLRKARKCRSCGRRFKNMDTFIKHSINDHGALQCEFCPRLFETKARLDRHLAKGHFKKNEASESGSMNAEEGRKDIFQCPYCTMYTSKAERYNKHMEEVHYEITCKEKMERGEVVTLKCIKCGLTSFQSVDELLQHKEEVHEMFKCEICLHCLLAKGYRQRHWETYHSEESKAKWERILNKNRDKDEEMRLANRANRGKPRKIKCEECGGTFDNRSDLFKHNVKEHPEKLFKCADCPESETQLYDTLRKLYEHKVLIHNEPKDPYRCKLCDYTSKNCRALEKHKQNKHFPKAKIICEVCSKQYATERYLQWHKIKEHGLGTDKDKKFDILSCKYCHKIVATPQYLRNHIRRFHMNQGEYKCTHENCNGIFAGQKQLDFHIRTVHTMEGYFSCSFKGCDKRCRTQKRIDAHFNRCHAPKKLKCEFCDYATNDADWLKIHEDVHKKAETRPYQCDYCGKSFAAFRYLTQHFRTHIKNGEMDRSDVPSYTEYKNKLRLVSNNKDDENDSDSKE